MHVRDVAHAVVCVLDAFLDEKLEGGSDGLCKWRASGEWMRCVCVLITLAVFVTSQEPTMTWMEINRVLGDVGVATSQSCEICTLTGTQVMYARGLIQSPGAKPFPSAVTDSLRDCKL